MSKLLSRFALAGIIAGVAGCAGPAEGEVFFPTWTANERPTAIVAGVLIERDACLFLRSDGHEALALWEEGYAYADGALLDSSGWRIARVGQSLHGGGGYGSDWEHAEEIIGTSIPLRCRPAGSEPWVLVYEAQPGPPPS